MGFDPSYVSHVEGRRHRPTEDFARRAENVLRAGGAIWDSYAAYEAARHASVIPAPRPPDEAIRGSIGVGLVVEREDAAIGLHHDMYHIVIRRLLHNVGSDPIVRFPVRIRVDRYPSDPRRSARIHHGAPLTWAEIGFTARHLAAADPAGETESDVDEPMIWRASYDSDAVKELWVRFSNGDRQFPLYPGRQATIEYAYRVSTEKWGPWFQRAIRFPTRDLHVSLDFPTAAQPAVWGTVSSLAAELAPLATPITAHVAAERTSFRWEVRGPGLASRYRFEWRLR
jgi:hypothetical protein